MFHLAILLVLRAFGKTRRSAFLLTKPVNLKLSFLSQDMPPASDGARERVPLGAVDVNRPKAEAGALAAAKARVKAVDRAAAAGAKHTHARVFEAAGSFLDKAGQARPEGDDDDDDALAANLTGDHAARAGVSGRDPAPSAAASGRDPAPSAGASATAAGASPSDAMRAWTGDTALAALEPVDFRWTGGDDVPPVGRGLLNLGNSCFINSILQALTHTAPLAKLCQSNRHTANCALTNANEPCAFCIIERHVCAALAPRPERGWFGGGSRLNHGGGHGAYHAPHDEAIAPEEVFGNLRLLARHFTRGRQEDAHELLRLSLESMDDSCLANCGRPSARGRDGHRGGQSATVFDPETGARLAPPTAVERIFQGRFRTLVKCQRCQGESKTFDPFQDVSLELPGREDRSSHGGGYHGSGYLRGADTTRGSVESALRNYTEEERLEGDNAYRCERCDDLCPATKRVTVHEAPAILVFHLKRFDYYGGKIISPVDFSERLTLGGHMSEDAEEAGPAYRLYAMVTHSGGSVSSGHYYTFVRKPTAPSFDGSRRNSPAVANFYGATTNATDDEWYLCDDSSVRRVSRADVFDAEAYVLFYQRDDEEAPPPHAAAPLSRWGPQALEPPKTVRTPSPPVDDDNAGDDAGADPVRSGDAIGPTRPPRGHLAAGKMSPGPDERPRATSVLVDGDADADVDGDDTDADVDGDDTDADVDGDDTDADDDGDDADADVNLYEQERDNNVARNDKFLHDVLGIRRPIGELPPPKRRRRLAGVPRIHEYLHREAKCGSKDAGHYAQLFAPLECDDLEESVVLCRPTCSPGIELDGDELYDPDLDSDVDLDLDSGSDSEIDSDVSEDSDDEGPDSTIRDIAGELGLDSDDADDEELTLRAIADVLGLGKVRLSGRRRLWEKLKEGRSEEFIAAAKLAHEKTVAAVNAAKLEQPAKVKEWMAARRERTPTVTPGGRAEPTGAEPTARVETSHRRALQACARTNAAVEKGFEAELRFRNNLWFRIDAYTVKYFADHPDRRHLYDVIPSSQVEVPTAVMAGGIIATLGSYPPPFETQAAPDTPFGSVLSASSQGRYNPSMNIVQREWPGRVMGWTREESRERSCHFDLSRVPLPPNTNYGRFLRKFADLDPAGFEAFVVGTALHLRRLVDVCGGAARVVPLVLAALHPNKDNVWTSFFIAALSIKEAKEALAPLFSNKDEMRAWVVCTNHPCNYLVPERFPTNAGNVIRADLAIAIAYSFATGTFVGCSIASDLLERHGDLAALMEAIRLERYEARPRCTFTGCERRPNKGDRCFQHRRCQHPDGCAALATGLPGAMCALHGGGGGGSCPFAPATGARKTRR
jgi:ubiquitin carboxyl-terminal hydrolase 36/42